MCRILHAAYVLLLPWLDIMLLSSWLRYNINDVKLYLTKDGRPGCSRLGVLFHSSHPRIRVPGIGSLFERA